jgi:hypothetical protein
MFNKVSEIKNEVTPMSYQKVTQSCFSSPFFFFAAASNERRHRRVDENAGETIGNEAEAR